MIGKEIAGYRINRFIANGGMAKVYEADMDRGLGTKVAIKILNKAYVTDPGLKSRFKQEAKSMQKLKHPNIINVFNYVEQNDTFAIIMEYLEGKTLKQMIEEEGPIPATLAVEIFTKILEALQYVHNKGYVHRDIKPSNIFVIEGKYPKLMDFGIVKLLGGESSITTKTGLTIGTPMYMSPEQIQTPKDIDYRTDIYSLGVTLFYALAGKTPYDSTESEYKIQTKVVLEPLPKLQGLPKNIDNTIKKACNKNREYRFQSCNEFIEGLHGKIDFSSSSNEETYIDKADNMLLKQNNSNKVVSINDKKENNINEFLAIYGEYFPSNYFMTLRDDLKKIDEKTFERIKMFKYKEPTKMILIAWLGGLLGLDRFMLEDTAIGILKLFTCWLTMGIWCFIDIFTVQERTRQWNYKKLTEIKKGYMFN